MYRFSDVIKAPADPILGLTVSFLKDPRPHKINLSVGIYKTVEGKTPILKAVKEAEKQILESETTKNYLPIEGDPLYLKEVESLVLGKSLASHLLPYLSTVQSLGGAGALRLGGEFLSQERNSSLLYIPDPSWPNHAAIFMQAGLKISSYPYYSKEKKHVDFASFYQFLSELPPQSIVLLHACCHNPSGADLSKEQWKLLSKLFLDKELLPFFDAAYLGFDGTFEEDAFALRLFASLGLPFVAAISFSKNFSLYAERVGALMLFAPDSSSEAILSQLKKLVRRNYSNPPVHGAFIVKTVLASSSLKQEWEEELFSMRERIGSLRRAFAQKLVSASMRVDYSYLFDKKGLFSFCDLTPHQVEQLQNQHAIYMTSDGRINIAGLNDQTIDCVVKALQQVGG